MKELLEKYFFNFIDKGVSQSETPLFSGVFDGKPLADAVAIDNPHLQADQIGTLICHARKEVEL